MNNGVLAIIPQGFPTFARLSLNYVFRRLIELGFHLVTSGHEEIRGHDPLGELLETFIELIGDELQFRVLSEVELAAAIPDLDSDVFQKGSIPEDELSQAVPVGINSDYLLNTLERIAD
jgi:hypothetical protein